MPPHQTHSTIDAAHVSGLDVDLSIASVTGAISSVQPSTQSEASIAALREVLSEKDAAGPPATPTWLIIRLIGWCWRVIQAWRRREYVRTSLYELSERELTDIGITRAEIEHIAALQTLDSLRHDPRYLVSRRGI
ncbi:DUF1127 domain-containing protein [Bradyrhizobium aeschynomenes]|uniref:DUF1127 domain-containing protein n=1 Tax=Bradyrhizobium aeschynomenes TaxID=2734909 RepID=UPI001553106E|nr:DUF1127 domain-containing protein [Bradyrhizobium aeschynomenes]NPV22635.1 DUF1127 domain-containing protein [Bradyrhizobium aeschynomenes]